MNTLNEFFQLIKESAPKDEYGDINNLILIQLLYEVKEKSTNNDNDIKEVFSDKFFEFNNSFILDTQIKALDFFEFDTLKEIFLTLQNKNSYFLKKGLLVFYYYSIIEKKNSPELKEFFLTQIFETSQSKKSTFLRIAALKVLIKLYIYSNEDLSSIDFIKTVSLSKSDTLRIAILSEIAKNLNAIIKSNKLNLFESLLEEYAKDSNNMTRAYLAIIVTKILTNNEYIKEEKFRKVQLENILSSIPNKIWLKLFIRKELFELINFSKIQDEDKTLLKEFIAKGLKFEQVNFSKPITFNKSSKVKSYRIDLESLSEESIIKILKKASLLELATQDLDDYDKNKLDKKISKYKLLNSFIIEKLFHNSKFKQYIKNYSLKYSSPYYSRDSKWFSFDQEIEKEIILSNHKLKN